ncbi:hypothetical protein L1987_66538 [Smallanthus sonchifolius]|uniref:Uncharacterized protein n=1 Tax=Smallanthus sonchifolius TaxID=185202 RepID=A0ACB9BXK1_9ASTR|nr:hypothetical protein L1987_66538 [Smallanthus sonchifolius]
MIGWPSGPSKIQIIVKKRFQGVGFDVIRLSISGLFQREIRALITSPKARKSPSSSSLSASILRSAVDCWLISSPHHYFTRSQDKCAWSYEIIPCML